MRSNVLHSCPLACARDRVRSLALSAFLSLLRGLTISQGRIDRYGFYNIKISIFIIISIKIFVFPLNIDKEYQCINIEIHER